MDEVDEERRPFKALLDVGIRSTSTGCVGVTPCVKDVQRERKLCAVLASVAMKNAYRLSPSVVDPHATIVPMKGSVVVVRAWECLPSANMLMSILLQKLLQLMSHMCAAFVACTTLLLVRHHLCPHSNRVFGCMKGATDGGLDIPHNEKRFPGYDRDAKSYDVRLSDSHRKCHARDGFIVKGC